MLTVMCGFARSGKSTWIEENKKETDVVICPDEIRKEIFGHQFYRPAEGFVWAFAKSMVRILFKQNKDVIIDATNLTEASRKVWYDIASEYDIDVRVIWITTSIEECKKRSKLSREGDVVPDDVLDKMYSGFASPENEAIDLIRYNFQD